MFKLKWLATLAVLAVVLMVQGFALAEDLSVERAQFKAILKAVASDVSKNFYDPNLKGLDWKATVDQGIQRIDNAKSVAEMMRSVFIVVEKLHDSHTKFLPPDRNVKYKFGFEAKPFGDGIYVYEVKKKGAAEKAGILPGDRILTVNGFNAERSSYDLMMFDFRLLRNVGVLDLTVQRDNEAPRKIKLEADRKVQQRVLDAAHGTGDIWDLINDTDGEEDWHYASFKDGIGYAQYRGFVWEGEDLFKGMVEKSGAKKALIIDFRSNGGGSVDTLKNIAGMFTKQDLVMAKIIQRKKTEDLRVVPKKPYYEMPIYVLIDSRTGSAAEMLSRHLQATRNAVVIGDKSAGRVTVSMFYPGELGTDRIVPYATQIGIGRAVFPDGLELENHGVIPDVQCIPSGSDLREDRDVCLWKAVERARTDLKLNEDASIKEVKKSVGAHL